jgi:hypothetical protein
VRYPQRTSGGSGGSDAVGAAASARAAAIAAACAQRQRPVGERPRSPSRAGIRDRLRREAEREAFARLSATAALAATAVITQDEWEGTAALAATADCAFFARQQQRPATAGAQGGSAAAGAARNDGEEGWAPGEGAGGADGDTDDDGADVALIVHDDGDGDGDGDGSDDSSCAWTLRDSRSRGAPSGRGSGVGASHHAAEGGGEGGGRGEELGPPSFAGGVPRNAHTLRELAAREERQHAARLHALLEKMAPQLLFGSGGGGGGGGGGRGMERGGGRGDVKAQARDRREGAARAKALRRVAGLERRCQELGRRHARRLALLAAEAEEGRCRAAAHREEMLAHGNDVAYEDLTCMVGALTW